MFYVGQKVTKIRDLPIDPEWAKYPYIVLPRYGIVYTVRDVVQAQVGIGLRFCEVRNPVTQQGNYIGEVVWRARDFRPLVANKLPECLTRFVDAPIADRTEERNDRSQKVS